MGAKFLTAQERGWKHGKGQQAGTLVLDQN